MKKNIFVILVGVAALHIVIFGGLAVGGCKNEVMGDRTFVPASPEESAPDANPAPMTPLAPADNSGRPAAQKRPTYQPMDPVVARPVTGGASAAVTPGKGESSYTVKAGDTASKIANAHGISLVALRNANNMTAAQANKLKVGQKLVIPAGGKPVVAKGGKSLPKVSKVTSAAAPVATDGTYTVKAGDSPDIIARNFKVKVDDLLKVNNISDPRRLQIGQKLVIPGKGSVPTAKPVDTKPADVKPVDSTAVVPEDIDLSKALDDAANATLPPAGNGAAPVAVAPVADTNSTANSEALVIAEDTTVEDVAKLHNTTVEALRAINGGVIPADGKLKAAEIIFVPKK